MKTKKNMSILDWAIKATAITLLLSLFFSFLGQFILSKTGIIVSLFILLFFITVNVVLDTIGMAVTACDLEPFLYMATRNEKGSLECISLIKNADKISNLCSDIIGDICGILSGAIGTTLAISIAKDNIYVATIISSIVSGVTVFFKAIGKNLAVNNSIHIVIKTGKFLNFFNHKKK